MIKKVTYYCIVRDNGKGKCDSLSSTEHGAGRLLYLWTISYPERKYIVQKREGIQNADGSVTWDKNYDFRPYANIP